jgi:hypothetical protein
MRGIGSKNAAGFGFNESADRRVKIFVFSAGEQTGPYTKEAIRKELLNGSLKPSDLAWHNRLRRWVPLQQLPLIEPKSSKKYSMPPNPKDSPFYNGDETAMPNPKADRSRSRTNWLARVKDLFAD